MWGKLSQITDQEYEKKTHSGINRQGRSTNETQVNRKKGAEKTGGGSEKQNMPREGRTSK